MNRRIVTPDCERPAGLKGFCFYCGEPVGGLHREECVAYTKVVKVRAIIEYEIDVPNSWGASSVEFQRNEGSWCAGNIIGELEKISDDGCLCDRVRFEYVGEA
jgi:hypothetical protein